MNHLKNYSAIRETVESIFDDLNDGNINVCSFKLGQLELTLQYLVIQSQQGQINDNQLHAC